MKARIVLARDGRVDAARRSVHRAGMSTLAEIEKAIATLPTPEQRELYRHLDARFRGSAVSAEDRPTIRQRSARDWARQAKGSVRLAPGESVDDARMAHYAAKYDVKP